MVTRPVGQVPPTIGRMPFDAAFPDRPVEFSHDLHLDDRLTLDALADLADRLPRQSVVCDIAGQSLLAPHGGPPRGALDQPGDVIRNLKTADAWLTLLSANDDPSFAALMNATLDELEPGVTAKQGKMRKRVAFIIVSSPNSVTPVHFDIERERRCAPTRDQPVLGRFPRADRGPSRGGAHVHSAAREGGVHTRRYAALGS
jgi:hypothetical protein